MSTKGKSPTQKKPRGSQVKALEPELNPARSQKFDQIIKNLCADNPEDSLGVEEALNVLGEMGFVFSQKHVENIIQGYGKPFITVPQLKKHIANLFREEDTRKEMKRAFTLFDQEKTGHLTVKGLMNICKLIGEEKSKEDLKAMIRMADRGSKGHVNEEDYMQIMVQEWNSKK